VEFLQSLDVAAFKVAPFESVDLPLIRRIAATGKPADLRAGDVLTRENLRAIRPGFGPPPKYLEALLGKCVVKAVSRGTPADWSIIG
jgi:sialic acid synthase SpsE